MVRICVLGSTNMDLVVRCQRLPEPGQTLLGGPFARFPGGKGANQAVAARRAGAEVVFLTALGDDAFGSELRADLEQAAVELALVASPGPSGVALITVDAAGENTIVVAAGANARLDPGSVDEQRPAILGADLLVAQLEVPLESVLRAARIARTFHVPFLLNAAPGRTLDEELLRHVDVLIVNRGEAARVLGAREESDARVLASDLLAAGIERGVITLGAAGCLSWCGAQRWNTPGFAVPSVDSVAAGDAFVGSYAVALAEGLTEPEAARRANAAGALATCIHGARPSLPWRADIDAFLERQGG